MEIPFTCSRVNGVWSMDVSGPGLLGHGRRVNNMRQQKRDVQSRYFRSCSPFSEAEMRSLVDNEVVFDE